MQELVIEAKIENLDKLNEFVHNAISDLNFEKKSIMQLDLIVEEIFVNIANYAYSPKTGLAKILLDIKCEWISLTFIDSGIPYNPLEQSDPDVNLSVDEREIGGLGIFLTKKFVDKISYQYINNQNVLTIEKILGK